MIALLAVAILGVLAVPAAAAETRLAERVVSYAIEARLDPDERRIRGRAVVRWKDRTRKPAADLCVHLYLNAFSNNRTTLMGGEARRVERWASRNPGEWGGIEVTEIRIGDEDVTAALEFIQPDDGNPFDRTVARLPLRSAVKPQASIEVALDFDARLPRIYKRAGHAAPFFLAAQWFPKLGVLEDGGWNCHQYHAATEFYADFGTYDVRLTVPEEFVVGSTGVVREERGNPDGTRTLDIVAEDVHDFAWAADPRFLVIEETVAGIPVRLLLQPEHRSQAKRYLEALGAAAERYARWFGPYPYPRLTVVDPPPGAHAAAGMEYPMMFTAGTAWWMPRGARLPEMLTVHEFGHQYWQGMVASDEGNEPWLDEGINTWVEGRIMDEVYGPGSYLDLFGLRVDSLTGQRLRYLSAGRFDPISRSGYRTLDSRSYAATSYAKTALVLATLDRHLGGDRLLGALGEYFRRWRFAHPTGRDWRRAIEAGTGEDLDWFFAQFLDDTVQLDYAVARVDVRRERPLAGLGVAGDEEDVEQRQQKRYRNEIVFERRGEARVPVDLLVVFEDGSEMRESWDGQDRWRRFDVTSTVRTDYAVIDPDGKLPLDADRLNNSRMRSAGTRGIVRLAGRWGLWMQGALHVLTGF
jgi:hypothetical protein